MTPEIRRSFEILGLRPGASQEQVKQAYRRLAKQWHPDRFPGDPPRQRVAQERFKEINLAYRRLIGAEGRSAEGTSQAGSSGESRQAREGEGYRRHAGAHQQTRETGGGSRGTGPEAETRYRTRAGDRKRAYGPEIERLRVLAHQGYPLAQNFLGLKYYKGEGVARDYAQAKQYFLRAAYQGLAKAQYNLGMMYYFGHGGPRQYEEAARWFRCAAERGFVRAQINLGVMYRNGYGVPKSPAQAEAYFYMATHGRPMRPPLAVRFFWLPLRCILQSRVGQIAQVIGLISLGLILGMDWLTSTPSSGSGKDVEPLEGWPGMEQLRKVAWVWGIGLVIGFLACHVALYLRKRLCRSRIK